MFQHRFSGSPRRQLIVPLLAWVLPLCVGLASAPAFAQVQQTLAGAPDSSPLSPHVTFPNLGTIPWPIDCSAWPEDPPDDGYLASIFGHRIHSGTDFHRGIDLRCDQQGDTCCQPNGGGPIQCGQTTCSASETEVPGAPIHAVVGGTVHKAKDGGNNNLVIKTERASDDISVGATDCDKMYVWYQHMRSAYAINPATGLEWKVGDTVTQGQHLGYQGKSGASSVHLHLSTRVCTNSRADGDEPGTLDPEINPFQLIGSDNGQAPDILSLATELDGADLLVTVRIETDDPDFDQLEIAVYDAPNDQRTVRRLGYNSRLGIDVAGDDIDTSLLEPLDLSELTTIQEPAPPVATSGFTLTARFTGLSLASDPGSRVQVKVADV
ncbi:MAG: M23 family metallopeptidase, partial [bacterium]|nr:M23 family metallopeptidase [bacterium]